MRRSFYALFFLLALLVVLPAYADETAICKVKALFHSRGSIGAAVIAEIRQARSTLLLALYGFDNRALAEELVKIAARGVSVSVKIDAAKSKEKRESKIVEFLTASGVRVQPVAAEGRNHNKFAVVDQGKVSGKVAREVFEKMYDSGESAAKIIEREGLTQISDPAAIEPIARTIVEAHPDLVAQYRSGEEKVLGFFVGQVMKATQGQANPKLAREVLVRILSVSPA